MPDTQPSEGTATIASQSIELLLTGKPDVPYKWGTGSIRPAIVIFTYGQDGIRAHLYGVWVREDGELTDDPCDQEYRIGDTDDWPAWLVELADDHDPRTQPAADWAALRKLIARAVHRYDLDHLLSVNDIPGEHHYGEADAVLSVLPASVGRAAVYAEVAGRLAADAEQGAKEGFTRIYRRSAAKQVREWGEELAAAGRATAKDDDTQDEWCTCRSCWGWFVEEHPGEDLDELGRDLGWWAGLPKHRDAPAGAAVRSPVQCTASILRKPHGPHGWEPQPGMEPIPCAGYPEPKEAGL